MTFLIGSCIAAGAGLLALGGQFIIAGHSDERETLQRIGMLDAKLEAMSVQMSTLQRILATVDQTNLTIAVLQVRVNNQERVVEKHEEVLKELQHYRVPLGLQSPPQRIK